jgi:ribose/xylose/arabinose/galactoside ABC-type transport system permease subunit
VRRTQRAAADRPPHPLVALVTRLVVAQAGLAAAIGLLYSRRHLPSIVITLTLVAALCGVALVVRSGSQASWLVAVAAESAFVAIGLFRFATSRYLGGTLFAIITVATLLHPAVARAFSGAPRRAPRRIGETGLAETADGAYGGRAAG